MCKGFGSALIGPALQWYINLPTRSISYFASLSDKFVEQFTSSRSVEKTSDGLYADNGPSLVPTDLNPKTGMTVYRIRGKR
ncbi:hypothetical protein F2Q68_00004631 [Brassica cretica]|uniref:Retrotransposon gag domain-containing protein n=2 Tax=Brassica cretica TaxID=69181 RepID=A0A8S9J5L4_BRACR|nr:hypothetical protein F2Q68_00004631 [Brassica cretica]KAF3552136.1 hypothetical protein DY000_02006815 [Brassica cretica]